MMLALSGREAELAAVRALVAGSRLVTLTGAGGAGKTRLGLQVAAGLLDGTGDGVWFGDLAPLRALEGKDAAGEEAGEPDAAGPGEATTVLTPRELAVLTLVAQGLSNPDIARRPVPSEHTVHRHLANILRKLSLSSRAAAAAWAARAGLV
jgi:DNA-binding CsgD family transcriptional regulator